MEEYQEYRKGIYNFLKMGEENVSQKLTLKNLDKTRRYFDQETEDNELMSKKPKKVCTNLSLIGQFLILASTITRYVSVFHFASSVGIPIGMTGFTVGLKIFAITAVIKKYKSIIKKKRRSIRK